MGMFREHQPAPIIKPGAPASGLYVDNFNVLGGSRDDVSKSIENFTDALAQHGIGTHGHHYCTFELESLGFVIDFTSGKMHHTSRRTWRFYLATCAIRRRSDMTAGDMQVWLGNAVCMGGLNPELLAILHLSYAFVQAHPVGRGPLTQHIKDEMRIFADLCFISECDLAAPYSREVLIGDASETGFCFMRTLATLQEVHAACQFQERWRFKRVPRIPDVPVYSASSIEALGGLSPLGGDFGLLDDSASGIFADRSIRLVRPGVFGRTRYHVQLRTADLATSRTPVPSRSVVKHFSYQDSVEVEKVNCVPPLARSWFGNRWHEIVASPWKYSSEHINIKEMRVVLYELQHHGRNTSSHGSHVLVIADSMVCCCCADRGRSKSPMLNAVCRRSAAYRLGCDLVLHLRQCVSKDNNADAGSRRWENQSSSSMSVKRPGVQVLDEPDPVDACALLPVISSAPVVATSIGPARAVLELFGGTGLLTQAVQALGIRTFQPFEVKDDVKFDLTRKATQRVLLSGIRSGFFLLHTNRITLFYLV
jgi:hypothetical protein